MRIFYIKRMSPSLAALPNLEGVAKLEASVHSAARLLKLLASEQRLLLLCRLIEGESSVGELANHVGLAHSATSRHLARMRAEGLVATRREAQTINYRLNNPAAFRVIDTLCDIFIADNRPPRARPGQG